MRTRFGNEVVIESLTYSEGSSLLGQGEMREVIYVQFADLTVMAESLGHSLVLRYFLIDVICLSVSDSESCESTITMA